MFRRTRQVCLLAVVAVAMCLFLSVASALSAQEELRALRTPPSHRSSNAEHRLDSDVPIAADAENSAARATKFSESSPAIGAPAREVAGAIADPSPAAAAGERAADATNKDKDLQEGTPPEGRNAGAARSFANAGTLH
jgi:hypothetical protein